MSNRTEVIIDGVRHMLTDEQIGNLVVEITPEQLEAMKLEIARERGEPEPVLYENDESPDIYSPPEWQYRYDLLVEKQERMGRIMKKIHISDMEINKRQNRLDAAKAGNYLPRKEWNICLSTLLEWREYRSNLWDNWKQLKSDCDTLVGDDTFLWGIYFNEAREVINPYFTNGDTEDIDNMNLLEENTVLIYRDTHE